MSDIIWGTVTKIITTNSFEMNVSHQKDTNNASYQDVEEIHFTEIDIPSIPVDENSRNIPQIEESLNNKFVKCEISGDISGNDASFNNIQFLGQILMADGSEFVGGGGGSGDGDIGDGDDHVLEPPVILRRYMMVMISIMITLI